MATTKADIAAEYPIPVYRFVVSFGEESIPFSEVSGLDIGVETITYKDGYGKKHMPGQPTDVNITLKRGLVKQKSQFYDWISSISLNLVDKKDITISLTNEDRSQPIVTWKVINAFPKKLTAPSINGGSNEASVEALEMMADDIKIEFH
ncbi:MULTISPECIES: phage tail protein [Pseudoalteromonas]|uniref:Phage tail protein n=2 Tax=Pseudoalteromonas TaxID=53246 RepID=A0ABT7EET7_9GAMM|nr:MULTISPECIES: phage tail protein [Pseudoalteromonas]ESP93264.1 putative phage tail region protein [Pseudoalteromonas luteoviolacea 2ta16]KZN36617.1 phage tail protein [Pseudoalteromonas luteoviolacea NCIMB 1944]MBQ4839614.1 phage tail protein [Pseudoalteromonas luteoviolacea]MCG7550375.1 phage tail protein [Pseudoalteromonas sp. Of7M-16]MDK2593780.1 phage tail protein [Pseudoalteromonas sp. P94(2023)]